MKKVGLIGFLIILFSLSGFSQGIYSKENLKQTSPEDLNLYLGKAAKLKKTGAVLTIAGPASFLTGVLIASSSYMGGTEASYKLGIGMVFAGMGATAAGIPIIITGSTRVNKVRKAMAGPKKAASIDLTPCAIYNYEAKNFQPGVRLRVGF